MKSKQAKFGILRQKAESPCTGLVAEVEARYSTRKDGCWPSAFPIHIHQLSLVSRFRSIEVSPCQVALQMSNPSNSIPAPFLASASVITDCGCVRELNEDCC